MAEVIFFVEGSSDSHFLIDYIYYLTGKKLPENDFNKIGGYNIELVKPNLYNENTASGGINLMIFDANGNFAEKQAEILDWKGRLKIDFQLFLFPNNNDHGNLETLLENITLPEHSTPIFDCFDRYTNCITEANLGYTLPPQKAKIYAYCEALLTRSKNERTDENRRNYINAEMWNLNSGYLNPLRDFLTQYIQ